MSPAQTRLVAATRSAIPRMVCVPGLAASGDVVLPPAADSEADREPAATRSKSPVASALASVAGIVVSCGTTTVVTSRTRLVHAGGDQQRDRLRTLNAMPLGPAPSRGPSNRGHHVSRVGASRSGCVAGIVIPTCTTAIVLGAPPSLSERGRAAAPCPVAWTGSMRRSWRSPRIPWGHPADRHRHRAIAEVLRERLRLADGAWKSQTPDDATRERLAFLFRWRHLQRR